MKKYIVAVSGGLDSVTLLNLLTSPSTHLQLKGEVTLASLEALRLNSELIVAHINHGIRLDSNKTEQFVRNLFQLNLNLKALVKMKLAELATKLCLSLKMNWVQKALSLLTTLMILWRLQS